MKFIYHPYLQGPLYGTSTLAQEVKNTQPYIEYATMCRKALKVVIDVYDISLLSFSIGKVYYRLESVYVKGQTNDYYKILRGQNSWLFIDMYWALKGTLREKFI